MQNEHFEAFEENLSRMLENSGLLPLNQGERLSLRRYFSLFVRWNSRINLSSVRDPMTIISRHLMECIACAQFLPRGIRDLLDFGSGGGLPGIPIAICRPEISVTLAESQGKKAAFLREAVRVIGITGMVFSGRAETLHKQFDCVTLRAVDKMADAVHSAAQLVKPGGWLAPITTNAHFPLLQEAAGEVFAWRRPQSLPQSFDRILVLGKKAD